MEREYEIDQFKFTERNILLTMLGKLLFDEEE